MVNGREAARGWGDAVPGDPLNGVVWRAGKLAGFGLALRAGDLDDRLDHPHAPAAALARRPGARAGFAWIGTVEASVAA